LKRFN